MESRSDYLSPRWRLSITTPINLTRATKRSVAQCSSPETPIPREALASLAPPNCRQVLRLDKPALAIEIYHQAAQSHPNDASGWEGLAGAYTRVGDFSQAIETVRSMPQPAYDAAVKHTGFLNSVAVLYSTQGQCTPGRGFPQPLRWFGSKGGAGLCRAPNCNWPTFGCANATMGTRAIYITRS